MFSIKNLESEQCTRSRNPNPKYEDLETSRIDESMVAIKQHETEADPLKKRHVTAERPYDVDGKCRFFVCTYN